MPLPSRADASGRVVARRRALGHALLVTVLTTAVTGCAHSLGGGVAPAPIVLAAAAMLTLAILAPVLGASASPARRLVAVALAQAVQHGLYALPHATAPTTAHGGAHAHHGTDVIPALDASMRHGDGDMLLAHVAAGAVTLAVLQVGARAVHAVARVLRGDRVVAILTLVAPLGTTRRARAVEARPAALAGMTALRSPAVLRGPPTRIV